MGFFTYAVTGVGFILIGFWESISSLNPTRNLNPTPSSSLSTQNKSTSIPKTKENPFSSSSSFILVSILSLSTFLNSVVSIFDAFNSKDRVGSMLQLQVLSLALLFLLYSALGLLNSKKSSYFWPDSVLELVLLFAFVEEFFLYYLQTKDTSGIENRYFSLLCVPIAICVVSTMLELRSKRSASSKLVRGIGLILQGTWFVQMGFSFYTNLMVHGCSLHENSRGNYTIKCKGHPEYHRGRAIATLQFNCHLALLVVLVVGMLSVMGKRNGVGASGDGLPYRPLGAEMQQMDNNVGNFTLDSDDDLDDGINEEDGLGKEDAAIVELGVNGHGSHA
ncbi:transmembrane protein 45B [Durio zibethinus]|uniref:Transmembrane protein 45B n=1 Tax=Durio zibethinus TaxID=66656 RepID=A0A6P6BBH6_DURZI|nr:transmembrane protein 45B [Durio zibethinus]XP_022774449.1 transmembrane protein 45B [Durio zibethinus]XP_022774450.1 transmembrane protein 45B [Durio zibethinus]XP_022774451.1 transmembrane protein 45B [Durio zibethinus]XP_022774452.1 transmembrane protein 45B [Durio zibethinus]